MNDECPATEQLLQFFQWQHLPAKLQSVSKPFHELANAICGQSAPSAERYNALRKLLESKDCAVRAALISPTVTRSESHES